MKRGPQSSQEVERMAEDGKTMDMDIEGEKFSVRLIARDGKVFAQAHVPGHGDVSVPDFGGGEARAVKEIRARLSVLARDARAPKKPESE